MNRILQEQRECAEYLIQQKGPDTEGATRGLGDWIAEEVLMLTDSEAIT